MSAVLIEVARARRRAALEAVEKRRENVFNTGARKRSGRPLFLAA